MALKLITSWRTLMMYAKAEGEARERGNPEEIRKAAEAHDSYRRICLEADEMIHDPLAAMIADQRINR